MTLPTLPSNMFIQAAPANTDFRIRVTWKDYLDEDSYHLYANTDSTPGPLLSSGANPQVINGWEEIAELNPNVTEFEHETIFACLYIICGSKNNVDQETGFVYRETTCFGPSNYAVPTFPVSAEVESLRVSFRATNRLGVQWIQSSDTTYSRVEISEGSNTLSTVENDTNQDVLFQGLQPNRDYTITVCVRNQDQTAASETCKSITAHTMPLLALAPSSISYNESDPNPRQRTIYFSYNNRTSNAASTIRLNLIKDDQRVDGVEFHPTVFDREIDYHYTFKDLEPFTSYEAWVVPLNESGVGTADGIGFTTPTEIKLSVQPLSGDSVQLTWVTGTIGQYAIECKNGFSWNEIYTIRVLQPGREDIVLAGMNGSKEVRVTWKLAFLRTQSPSIVATPLPLGTPELVSVDRESVLVSIPTPLGKKLVYGTRYTVRFRTTVADFTRYILRRQTANGTKTVGSTGSRPMQFPNNTIIMMQYESPSSINVSEVYTVCKRNQSLPTLLCTLSGEDYASKGIRRVQMRN